MIKNNDLNINFVISILDENNEYQKLLPINSLHCLQDQFNKQNTIEYNRSIELFSSSDRKSIELTKSELIQCILDSLKPILSLKSSSDNTRNTSLTSIDETINSCQSENLSNKIFIHFKDKNELGIEPSIDDLLEEIEYSKKCLCHRIEIIFNNQILNQQLSYKQKQLILRIILRRQLIFDQYFS